MDGGLSLVYQVTRRTGAGTGTGDRHETDARRWALHLVVASLFLSCWMTALELVAVDSNGVCVRGGELQYARSHARIAIPHFAAKRQLATSTYLDSVPILKSNLNDVLFSDKS